MKYKKAILFSGLTVLAILYGIYKASPTISRSLQNEGFKLVSNAKDREEIYRRILARYREDINRDIKLDDDLLNEDKKWVALSFWCDKETSNKKFFVSVEKYKKYCVMSMADYLEDGYLKGQGDIKEDEAYVGSPYMLGNVEIYKDLFKKKSLEWKTDLYENRKAWINWCKTRPFKKDENSTLWDVRTYCFEEYEGDRELLGL